MIAEVRRAPSSKGELAGISSPDVLAAEYEQSDVAVIFCLIEERRFRGSLVNLDAVRRAVSIPMLRKDFIVTPYQIHEAYVRDADLVLLICSALDQPTLESLPGHTESFGMNALIEAYTAEEVECAEAADAKTLGINVRNLKTPDMDFSVYEHLAPILPNYVVRAAESGVKGSEELRYYASHDADAVLVDEGLVTAGKPGGVYRHLVAVGIRPALRSE